MISLKKSVEDLDRALLVEDSYRQALDSVAEYPVVISNESAEAFARDVKALKAVVSGSDFRNLNSSLRSILRDYRETSAKKLDQLRADMDATLDALRDVTQVLTARDEDHHQRLKQEIGSLGDLVTKELAASDLRAELKKAVAAITLCVEEIQRENYLTVTQLRHEMAVLHRRIDLAQQAAALDPVTGLFHAAEMRNFIAKAVSAGQSFALVFTRITNYRRLVLHTERAVLEKALNDLGQRLAQILQEGDVRGRWSEEEFVALVTADRPRAMQASRDITFRCSGPYPVQVSGRNTTISLSVASGVVEPKSHESVEDLLRRSDQLLRILIGDR